MFHPLLLLAASAAAPEQHPAHDHAPRLGQIQFSSTCDAKAQPLLIEGLGWLHSFEYDEAERDFGDAAKVDPGCGIALWGVAMTQYHPLWAAPSAVELDKGRRALARARAAGARSERERAYIAALGAFYDAPAPADLKTRVLAYEAAMERLHRRYPDDREAAVFYALALIAAGTLDTDPAYRRELAAAAILNRVFASVPDHPGVAHYLIHGYDYPALAHLALPAARRYAAIAPASAHAQHMPSHIFVRLGLWDEAIASNKAAEAAALAYAASRKMPGAWDERLHAMDYLAYAYLQTGRDAEARRVLDELTAITRVDPPNFKVAYAATAIPARYALERRQWREAATLQLPASTQGLVPWTRFRWAEAHLHLARAIGAGRSGDAGQARAEAAILGEIERDMTIPPGEYDWRRQVRIARMTAEAWAGFAEGNRDTALAAMRAAAELDDETEKHPVTPGSIAPAREQLGELLMELGRPAEALAAWRAALRHTPNRFAALYGAARAAEEAGQKAEAARLYADLLKLAAKGDSARPELVRAKARARVAYAR